MKYLVCFFVFGMLSAQGAIYRFNNHVLPEYQVVAVASFSDGLFFFPPYGESVEFQLDAAQFLIGGFGVVGDINSGSNMGGFPVQPGMWPDDPDVRVIDILGTTDLTNIEGRLSDGDNPLTIFRAGMTGGFALMGGWVVLMMVRAIGRVPES